MLSAAQARALRACDTASGARVGFATAACLVPSKLLECVDVVRGVYRTIWATRCARSARGWAMIAITQGVGKHLSAKA